MRNRQFISPADCRGRGIAFGLSRVLEIVTSKGMKSVKTDRPLSDKRRNSLRRSSSFAGRGMQWLLAVLLLIGAGNAWANATVTFSASVPPPTVPEFDYSAKDTGSTNGFGVRTVGSSSNLGTVDPSVSNPEGFNASFNVNNPLSLRLMGVNGWRGLGLNCTVTALAAGNPAGLSVGDSVYSHTVPGGLSAAQQNAQIGVAYDPGVIPANTLKDGYSYACNFSVETSIVRFAKITNPPNQNQNFKLTVTGPTNKKDVTVNSTQPPTAYQVWSSPASDGNVQEGVIPPYTAKQMRCIADRNASHTDSAGYTFSQNQVVYLWKNQPGDSDPAGYDIEKNSASSNFKNPNNNATPPDAHYGSSSTPNPTSDPNTFPPGNSYTCTVTNTASTLSTLSMTKVLGGNRITANDQFVLTAKTGGVNGPNAATVTTAGSNNTINSGTESFQFNSTVGTAYTLNEAMAANAGASSLSQYTTTVNCTNASTDPAATNVSGAAFKTLPITVTPKAGDAISCTVTNTPAGPSISLKKFLGANRIAANDQFVLSGAVTSTSAAVGTPVTTTGTGSTIDAANSTYSFVATAGTGYTLREAMAGGSGSTLQQYSQDVSCTNSAVGGTDVSGINSQPIQLTPQTGDAITCTIINSPRAPTLSLQKALGGSGRIAANDQFSLSGTGSGAPVAVTTTGTGSAITSSAYSLTATAGSAYTLNEAMAAGSPSTLAQYSQTVACTNPGPTNVSTFTTLPISVTPVVGDAISCTVTNTPKAPTLSLQKAMGTGGRIAANDQFNLAATGTGAPAATTTTGSGSSISSAAYSFTATAGSSYTLDETMAAGSTSALSKYNQTVACSNSGPTNVSGFTTLPISVTPQLGDAISCVITNTPKLASLSLQKALSGSGRIAASDQFSLFTTGAGAAPAVTTTGSGSTINSTSYSTLAVAGSSYTLNEAMAAGSASVLSQYNQTLNCTNTGPTDVSGWGSLPITVTPQANDAISCVVTNTPANSGGGPGQPLPICNGDPIVSGSDFTSNSWTKAGPWEFVQTNNIALYNDQAVATLSQNLQGVTPSAMVTFTWRFRNGVTTAGDVGNQSRLRLKYNGVIYWTGLTSGGAGSAPASTVSGGATCVSGCGSALAAQTDRVIKVRLPSNIPLSGTLQFEAEEFGGTSDDPEIRTPVTMTSTGICLAKNSLSGTGKFDFTSTNLDSTWGGGGTTASITTTAANTPTYYDANATRVNNQPLIVKNPGSSANVTITETPATGFTLDSVSCTGLTPVRSGNTITINNVPLDTVSTCTFINRGQVINLSKALNGNRASANDNFSVAIRTGGVNGAIVSSTANSTTTGSGAVITAGTGTTGDFFTTDGTAYTLTEAGTAGTNLANYTSTLTCTDLAGVTPAASLPNNESFDPAVGRSITPVMGANLRCVVSNRSKFASLSLQKALGGSGRLSALDQFTLSGTGSGAPAAITTTGSGANISSAPYAFAVTPGSNYSLNESMAINSASGLSQYNQTVRCTNPGTTDVSTVASLPIVVTPAGGDDISCVVTNTPNGSGPPTPSNAICNADPILSGGDLSNSSVWSAPVGGQSTDGTWREVNPSIAGNPSYVMFNNDDDATGAALTQQVSGVTPGALLTFTWAFRNGVTSNGAEGAASTLKVLYNGVVYLTVTTSAGPGNAGNSIPSNSSSCEGGCTPNLAELTNRTVRLRLPASIPLNGELKFLAQSPNGNIAPGVSDDIFVRSNISIQNTGICLVKTSRGGPGSFNFTTAGVNTTWGGSASPANTQASITTPAANTPTFYDASSTRVNSQPLLVLNPGNSAGVTITESATTGFVVESISCDGVTPASTTSNSVTINSVTRDTVASCTFTNRSPIINLSKALGGNRVAANDQFKVAIRTGGVSGGIVSSTANATTAGSGSTVTAGTGTTGDFYTMPGQTYTLTESGVGETDLSNYRATLTCTDSAGVTPAASLPNLEAYDPAAGRLITPVSGANLQCVITNTFAAKAPTLTGKVILDTGIGAGGSAHDGVQNGTESGRAGVTVRLTNCGNIEFGSAVTDANGNFSINLSTALNTTACLVKSPSSGFVAVSGNPGTTAGTYTQSTDTLQFSLATNTSYSGIVLGEVPMSSLLTDGQKQALPGSTVVYAHTYNAGTAASVAFSTSDSAPGTQGIWTSQVYRDTDCNGQLGPSDQPINAPLTVTAGQVICLLNVVNVPAGATDGANNVTTLTAQETLTPTPAAGPLVFTHTRTDTTTVGLTSSLILTKEVRRLSGNCPTNAAASMADGTAYGTSNSAKAGDAIEYRVTYRNDGSSAATNVTVTDSLPTFTIFKGAWCLSTPTTGLSGCAVQSAPANGATSGAIIWKLTDAATPPIGVQSGAQGTVGFCVTVQQ